MEHVDPCDVDLITLEEFFRRFVNQIDDVSFDLHEQPADPKPPPGHLCCWNSTSRLDPCGHGQFFQCEGPSSENNPLKNGDQSFLVVDLPKKPLINPTQAFGNLAEHFIDLAPAPALKLIGNECNPQKGTISAS